MDAEDAPRGIRRAAINVFLVALLFVLGASGLPTIVDAQARLREWIDPFVDGIGLWQGQWELFAPEPDKINVAVVAIVEFDDGYVTDWRSPDWRTLTEFERFRHFRTGEYTDGIRQNANRGAWPALADYARRTAHHPTNPHAEVVRVSLWRDFVVIPRPAEPLRPRAQPFTFDRRFMFFTKTYP
ncbi:MAG: hypothetical protein R3A78_04620 [Polyangiales bacterium]|nr:hypothetical protein [Myxococcales bacterium]